MNEELKEEIINNLEKGYIPLFKETPMKIIFDRLVTEFDKVAIQRHSFLGRMIIVFRKSKNDEKICKELNGVLYKGFCIFRYATIFEEDCSNLFQNEGKESI